MSSKAVVLPSNLPVGFRFHPTEEEVIAHYLRHKILGRDSEVDPVITEVDFCKFDPWDLPLKSKIKSDDPVWWFFTMRDFKDSNRKRLNRKTKAGFWKITGTEIKIKGIGGKRVLVFHKGPCPGKGTGWVMHEYYHVPDKAHPSERAYVVCRLEFKPDEKGQKAGTPDYDKSDPVVSVAIPRGHGNNEVNLESFAQPLNSSDSGMKDKMLTPSGPDKSEESPTKSMGSIIIDPEETNCGATTEDLFTNASPRGLSKRSHIVDGPVSNDTDNEGVNQQCIHTSGSSSSFGFPDGTKKMQHMQVVKTPSETRCTSTCDNTIQETVVTLCNQFTKENASSDGLTAYVGEINSLDLVTEKGHEKRIQPQKKVSSSAMCGNKRPDNDIGESSGEITLDLENPVASVAMPMGHDHNEENLEFSSQPLYSPDFFHIDELLAPIGDYELEDYLTEILSNSLAVDSEEDDCGATTDNLFNNSNLRASKRSYFLDGPISSDIDNEGVNKRCIRTWNVQSGLVHLFAQRNSSICNWLRHQVKLYTLLRLKIPYKKQLLPLVVRVPKRILPLVTQLHM